MSSSQDKKESVCLSNVIHIAFWKAPLSGWLDMQENTIALSVFGFGRTKAGA